MFICYFYCLPKPVHTAYVTCISVNYTCTCCAAVRVVRGSSSGQFVKISSTHVERTTTVLSTNVSVIDVRRVATSAVYKRA